MAAVGRRKEAVARVRMWQNGRGEFIVNTKPMTEYFSNFESQLAVTHPLKQVGLLDKVNIHAKIQGGGKTGQTEALRHGISRALILLNPEFRKALKPLGFLRRDARVKERKKPGLKKARRAPQWQKR
ncbi:MAG: 30S ribosomal protein S9 [Patescibacteria group bacterium]